MDKNLQNCDAILLSILSTEINDNMKITRRKVAQMQSAKKIWGGGCGHYYTPESVQQLILSNLFLGNFAN